MLATSISMIIAFGLHCIMDRATLRNSILQTICFDFFRDSFMLLLCLFYDGRSKETCQCLLSSDNDISLFTFGLIAVGAVVLSLFYGYYLVRYMFTVVITMIAVEYLARWFDGVDIYYQVDLMTVYLLIWQLIVLVLLWMWHDLASPILLIEQGSFCVLIGLEAFMLHNIALRYLLTKITATLFWILSVIDIFLCFHHHGALYIPSSNAQTSNSKYQNPPVVYYVGDENGERNGAKLGLCDFLINNILLLLVLSPLSSMAIKILITLGCVVSVQVGYVGTAVLFGRIWKNNRMPALPLPVITFSIYSLILGIVTTSSAQCVE